MTNILEYKGYYTKVEFSAEDQILYLAVCEDLGESSDKPYKGIFNVRISPELHRKAAMAADKNGETLNAFVTDAIKAAVG